MMTFHDIIRLLILMHRYLSNILLLVALVLTTLYTVM